MKKHFLFFLPVLTLLSGVLHSCKESGVDCPPDEQNIINLTEEELSKVPYTGTDTLYFLGKSGDTNIVVGQGKTYFYDRQYLSRHPSCPNNGTNELQGYKIQYAPIKGNLSFELTQASQYSRIIISKPNYPVDFIVYYPNVGFKGIDGIYYIDSSLINSYKYGRIYVAHPTVKATLGEDTTYTSYYNKLHGVLLIKSKKENEEYSILPKP